MVMGQDTRTHGVFGYDPALGAFNVERFLPDNTDDRFWDAALTVQGKISNFDLTYAGSFMRRDDTFHTDYSDYSLAYDVASGFGNAITNDAGQLINPAQELTSKIKYVKQSHELRIATPKDEPVRAIVGVFWQRQENDVQADFQIDDLAQASTVTGYTDTWWLSTYKRIDRDVAEFGELSWDVLPSLTLTGGIRFSRAKNSLEGFAGTVGSEGGCFIPSSPNGINAPCTNFAGVVEETSHTPKANISYHIDSDRMVYATYSEGFRPGGDNRKPGVAPYLSDYLKNYEVGWKTTWLDHRVRWNGAFFWEDWNKFQFAFQGANGLIQVANGGQARIKGLESELSWAAGHGLTLSTAVTLMDPKLTQNYCGALGSNGAPITQCTATPDPVTGAQLLAPSGTQLPLTNKFKGNLQARYVFPIGDFSAHLQGTFVYQSSARVDLRDQDNALLGGNVPGYGTANFTAGIERSNYSLEFFVTNAFNRLALANRYTECLIEVCAFPGVRPGVGGLIYDAPIQPRVIGIQFGQKF
jgi:outer membrane receptor protein involved in Fe transport